MMMTTAIFYKEVLPKFLPVLSHVKVATEATEQTIAPFTPDPKAEIITQDGTTGCSHNH